MSNSDRTQRALNFAALAVLAAVGSWIAWSQATRWAERRAQEARWLDQEEQERQRKAARPRLPARPIGETTPEGDAAHGPSPCLVVVDLADNGQIPGWDVATSSRGNASLAAQEGRANTIRFTMGENRFNLPSGAAGVKVSLKWAAIDDMGEADASDVLVRLTSGGQPLGANKALNAVLPLSLAFTDYGGPADTWGSGSLIPAAAINSPDFGVDVCVETGSLMCAVTIAAVEVTAFDAAGAAVGSARVLPAAGFAAISATPLLRP